MNLLYFLHQIKRKLFFVYNIILVEIMLKTYNTRYRHHHLTRKKRGGADNDRKFKSNIFGTIPHLQTVLKEGGVPTEYVDSELLDPLYVNVTGDAITQFKTTKQKLSQQMKILKYLADLEKALEENGDLTDFRKHAIQEYKDILKVEFGPSLLTNSSIEAFNNNVTKSSKTFLHFIFAYENQTQDQNKNKHYSLEYPHNTVLDRYLAKIKKETKVAPEHFNEKIKTIQHYSLFIRRWTKVGKVLANMKHEDIIADTTLQVAYQPLVQYWTERHKRIQSYFDNKFKVHKGLLLPHTLSERQTMKRADQRQLLMLLCGDVPAELFVDPKSGSIRNEQQISHHILFLTRPYNISNTVFGNVMRHANHVFNTARKRSVSIVETIGWFVVCFVQAIGLISAVLTFFHFDPAQKAMKNIIFVLLYLLKTFLKIILRVTGLKRSDIRAYSLIHDVDGFMRFLNTAGASYVVWRILNTVKVDISSSQRVSVLRAPLQKAIDKMNMVRAMYWISQLEEGTFGESTVSGISDEQLGLMQTVQQQMKQLDLEIAKTRQANIDLYMRKYHLNEKSRSRREIFALMNAYYRRAIAGRNKKGVYVNPRHLRAKCMERFPHEFRVHHFFDSYGVPRSALQITIAYFCYWEREQRELTIPIVPYNDNDIHTYFHPDELDPFKRVEQSKRLVGSWVHFNPIQSSEFYRKINTNPMLNDVIYMDSTSQYEEDHKEAKDKETGDMLHQHINITDIFTNEKHYTAWLESKLPNNAEVRDKLRSISGWTHKLSPALQYRLQKEFQLNTRDVVVDYKEFAERQLRYNDPDSDFKQGTSYLINGHNDYNIFMGMHDSENQDDFNALVRTTFAHYSNTKQVANEHDELMLALNTLGTLPFMEPLAHARPPSHSEQLKYINDNKDKIKQGITKTLGTYVFLNKDISDEVLVQMSPDAKENISDQVKDMFTQEQKKYLDAYINQSNFKGYLQTEWYMKMNPMHRGGGGFVQHSYPACAYTQKRREESKHLHTKCA